MMSKVLDEWSVCVFDGYIEWKKSAIFIVFSMLNGLVIMHIRKFGNYSQIICAEY